MKTREQKQKDLKALTEKLNNSKSAMVVGFNKVTVSKDQEFRNQLREVGAQYQVVKNTIARLAVKESPYTEIEGNFDGMTAIAWTETDPVVLSKAVSKFIKDNKDLYSFKVGIVEGKVVDLNQIEAIASLPSKEELISKLLFVINAQAQRLVTVINAVPRNLAVVIKQIGDQKPDTPAAEPKAEAKEEQPKEEVKAEETEQASEQTAAAEDQTQETVQSAEAETPQETEPETGEQTEEKSE